MGDALLRLPLKLRSRYARPAGLLLRDRRPLLLPSRLERDRLKFLDLDRERGDIERRGGDLVLEGDCDLASANVCCLERVRPRSGEIDGMLYGKTMSNSRQDIGYLWE